MFISFGFISRRITSSEHRDEWDLRRGILYTSRRFQKGGKTLVSPERTGQNEPTVIIVEDESKTLKFTDQEIKRYINAVTHRLHDLPYDRPQEEIQGLKYEFGAICWWLGNCEFLQFIDTLPEIPYKSRDRKGADPDIYAIFKNDDRTFPCFIVIAEFDEGGKLTMYSKYIERVGEYPLIADIPILVAAKYANQWTLINLDSFYEGSGKVCVSFEEAQRGNVLGMLCGDARFNGLRKDTSWYYIIETEEDLELIRQNIVPLRDPVTEISLERPEGEKVAFRPALLELLPFFGTWRRFEEYREDLVISGAVLTESKQLYLHQTLVFATRFSEQMKNADRVDWKCFLGDNSFSYSVADMRNILEYGQKEGIGFGGYENYLPDIDIPHWLADLS